ncbi:MAG: hypothetical protein AAF412_05335, partial [Pseudomonadota bacterium]
AGAAATAAAISGITQRVDELESQISEISTSNEPTEDVSPKVEKIEADLAELKQAVDNNAEGVSTLISQSSTLQETVASVKASEKVARSVAVSALGAALENDDPISLAIASIESLGGKSAETERLSEIAKQGVPTTNALLSGLAQLTDTVQNPVADTASGSISDRFWANAKNLVSFRSSGPLEGETPIATLSRVKANLETGNLSGVLQEWKRLPAEVRKSGESWIASVNLRTEAFALYQTLSTNLAAEAG